LYPRAESVIAEERPAPKRRPSLPSAPLTPQTQAEIEDLTRAIRAAVDAEIGERAAHLATTDDAHRFGQNALTIRALDRSEEGPWDAF
jgi:hypothetical protein